MHQSTSWTSRVKEPLPHHHGRQGFHHANTAMGAAHWVREAGILAPLVISEFVKDNDKRWRYIRMASVATALVSEGLYTARVHHRREEERAKKQERCPV